MGISSRVRLAIVGDLVDADLVLAELCLRQGAQVGVFRTSQKEAPDLDLPFYTALQEDHIHRFSSSIQLVLAARAYDFVYSVTSNFFFRMRVWSLIYPLLVRLGWPRYMVVCSGSNITERAVEKSIAGFLERISLRQSSCIALNNYPHAIENAVRLRLSNCVFLPFPYAVEAPVISRPVVENDDDDVLRVFHPGHLDWQQSDPGRLRNSTKGNDRFLRAFIRACKKGLNARCLIVDHGLDRVAARDLVREMDGERFFVWKPHLTRAQYYDELAHCDLVVDQFDVGAFGGIAVEAMASSKPVMGFVDRDCHSLMFNGDIPVVLAHTEEEIEEALWRCRQSDYRRSHAEMGAAWVRRYQNPEIVGRKYLFCAQTAVGPKPGSESD